MEKKKNFIISIIYYLIILLLAYFTVKYALLYIFPFVLAFIIVYVLQKPSIFIYKKTKINKNFLTLLMLIFIIFFIVFIIIFSANLIKNFILEFNSKYTTDYLIKNIENIFNNIKFIPEKANIYLNKILNGFFNSALKAISKNVSGFILNMPDLLFSVVTFIVACTFFCFYYDKMIICIKKYLSKDKIIFIKKLKNITNQGVSLYIKGYLVMLLLTYFQMLLGLRIIKIANAAAIALIIAIVDLLPVFGTGSILIPWGVISIINADYKKGIYLLILYALYTFIRYFTEPKIIGKNVDINPLLSLFSMFVGLKLFGIIGIILLPVLCSITKLLIKNKIIVIKKE